MQHIRGIGDDALYKLTTSHYVTLHCSGGDALAASAGLLLHIARPSPPSRRQLLHHAAAASVVRPTTTGPRRQRDVAAGRRRRAAVPGPPRRRRSRWSAGVRRLAVRPTVHRRREHGTSIHTPTNSNATLKSL